MKNVLLFLLATTFHLTAALAQSTGVIKKIDNKKGISVSAGINIPVSQFSSTHLIGVGIDCSPSHNLFGIVKSKKIALTYNGGLSYYFGKKEMVSGYPYDYPGYIFIHAFCGVLYNPVKSGSVSLTAGPALGIYNGNTRFNFGSKLEASYYISKNIGIGPGIILMKEPGATSLWAASFKATLNL